MRTRVLPVLLMLLLGTVAHAGSKRARKNGIVTTASGLQYQDVKVGAGDAPTAGQVATVHYTGTFKDGTKFDSSVDRGQPFKFKVGVGQVIPGFDEGVLSMKVGGLRKLLIPAKLGYGERGVGSTIPPNSELRFEVELLALE